MALKYLRLDRATNSWMTGDRKTDEKPAKKKKVGSPVKMKKFTKNAVRKVINLTTTTFTGVYFYSSLPRPWEARITINGRQICLGYYEDDRRAALAYDKKAIQLGRPTNILKPISA